jgi:hypothetical protein
MNTNISIIEPLLFEYMSYVKRFLAYLGEKYQLTDIPFDMSGKAFPRIGSVTIDSQKIDYRFHGRGCTLYWGKLHIYYDIDATSIHQTIISPSGMDMFLEPIIKNYDKTNISNEMMNILIEFENLGVLMKRKPSDLGTFHVNELWFKSFKNSLPFYGENKNDIDWI